MKVKWKLNLILKFLADLIVKLRSIILIPILIKFIGTEEYGAYSQVLVISGFVSIFTVLGLDHSIMRFLSGKKNKREMSQGFYSSVIVVLFISLILSSNIFFFSKILSDLFIKHPKGEALLKISFFIIVLKSLDILVESLLRAINKVNISIRFQMAQAFMEVILIVIILLINFDNIVVFYFITFVVQFVITSLKYSYIFIKEVKPYKPKIVILKQYYLYGVPLIFSSLGITILNVGDRFVIGYFLNTKSIAIYSVCYTIGSLIFFLSQSIFYNLRPEITMAKNNNDIQKMKEIFNRYFNIYIFILTPGLLGLLFISGDLLELLGFGINSLNNLVFITGYILVGIYIYQMHRFYEYILIIYDKTKTLGFIYIVAAGVNMLLNLILVPIFSVKGAAISTLITYTMISILLYSYSRRLVKITRNKKVIFGTFACTLVMTLVLIIVSFFIDLNTLNNLIVKIISGILTYSALIYIIFRNYIEKNVIEKVRGKI